MKGISTRRLILLWLGLLATACSPTPAPPPGPAQDTAAVAENNRGVGLMGQFRYAEAAQAFQALVTRYPDWNDARINLVIALLNRQQEGDEQEALRQVDKVLQQHPDQLRAQYVAGLLRLYLASPAEALPHFRAVAKADPKDAYAAYYLGQCLAQKGDYAQALDWYRRAMRQDPYLRSAYYGAFQALQRLHQRDQARRLIQDYQRLANNPRAHLAEFKYTRMGPKAEARSVGQATRPTTPRPSGPLLAAASPPLPITSPPGPASLTVADLNDDGILDLFLAGNDAPSQVLRGTPDGFQPVPGHPLAQVLGVRAVLWGDLNNDGRLDAYLLRQGPNQWWQRNAKGQWRQTGAGSGLGGGGADSVDGAMFDADHDGDLDLFVVNADAPDELFSNNLDGTFRTLAKDQGLDGGIRPSLQVLPLDLDGDRDLDLLVLHAKPPQQAWLNDRLWNYRPATGLKTFLRDAVMTATSADRNADGWPEIYTLDDSGTLLSWERGRDAMYHPDPLVGQPPPGPWASLRALDLDGDGGPELLLADKNGWRILDPDSGETLQQGGARETRAVVPILRNPKRGPALVQLSAEGLSLFAAGSGRYPFVALSLSGKQDGAQSMRSNASGLGTTASLRTGERWSRATTLPLGGASGQGLQPLALGLGTAAQADFVALDWSDGVYQTELALGPGLHRISETQRQLSSCPVLFAWDGQRHTFVTDLLGVGGIGFNLGRGVYAKPRPWEHLLLPEGLLVPKDGYFVLTLSEPMEEATYLDQATLVAYDLPPGWGMIPDERMGVGPPEPTGKALFFRRQAKLQRATDGHNQDLLKSLARTDGDAAPPGRLDRRFIGRLAKPQVITLEFGQPLDRGPGEPLLTAFGWLEYPYSQTLFAAWQAGAAYQAPSLEARDEKGRWQMIYPEFGYPAGMPRPMALPLKGLPKGTTALRLSTTQEIYWDRLGVAWAEPSAQVVTTSLPLSTARLAKRGFPLRKNGPQGRPGYHYAQRQPFWDTRYMEGLYTRTGPVEALLSKADDALAIFGPGEEIRLKFTDTLPPLPPGWSRRFVLQATGWAKDMDLLTRDGETVAPLPHRKDLSPQAKALHARYNTRYQAGP